MKKNKGKIITVVSTKGGVGKTTTVLNLAGIYHLMGLKTLIIDFSLYGSDIAASLNCNNEKTLFNLAEDLSYNRYETIEDYISVYIPNIHVIAAPKDPRQAAKIDERFIPLVLNSVLYKYDVILIDTAHVLGEKNIIVLDNSDSILVMFSNDLYSLKNTKTFLSILKDANYDNYYTLLNEAIDPNRCYYSAYDIRNIIKNNIDYTFPKSLYIKNIDKIVMDGFIPVLSSISKEKKGLKKLEVIAKKLIEKDGDL